MRGKLIRRTLKTDVITIANPRLAVLEKAVQLLAGNATAVSAGKMTVGETLETCRIRPKIEAADGRRIVAGRDRLMAA